MAKMRVYDIAKELGVPPKELIDMLASIGVTNKVPSSSIEDTAARSLRQMIENKNNPEAAKPVVVEEPAAPAAFQDFRKGTRTTPPRELDEEVSSDVIQDYREQADLAGMVVQGPAKSGPGARRDASSLPAAYRPKVAETPAPDAAAAAAPAPAAPAPAAPANNRPERFQRGGRGGGRRNFNRRDERGPRFGDKDFRVEETEAAPDGKGKTLSLAGEITVTDLAAKIDRPVSDLIKKLFTMSIMRAANQPIPADVAGQLVADYGYSIEVETARPEEHVVEEDQGNLVPVPPVVTIMGHVDHGKTSLLDIIRSANVQSGEAGGITQRIGAYETSHNGERIVFLDTPGHEAFARMRARGAHITDIAVVVVAADDGVMPQTREAIEHARAARVPIIIAMNKMDRAEADPNRVKGELAEVGLIPEDYGGDTIVMPVSAKTGMGVPELLDMILLVAELQELKANPEGFATGTVIEARQDPQRGAVATVLLHRGTLHVGDNIVVGDVHGRVRALLDYKGTNLQEAGPKTPVAILGLSAVPHASDTLRAVESARIAREQAEQFAEDAKQGRYLGTGRATLDEIFSQIQNGVVKELNVIVKADAQGSVEAMCQSLEKLAHDEVRVKILSRGSGNVSENDVLLAEATGAIIIAFAVNVENSAASLADRDGIEIRKYDVIYAALDDVKAALEGMLTPLYEEKLSGEADVRDIFESTKAGTIAGCTVMSGKLLAGSVLRVWRNGRRVFDGKLDSLRHYKDEVKEMVAGQDCGVSAKNFNDFQKGDVLQSIALVSLKRDIEKGTPEPSVVGPPGSDA
ncbi:MAG TPA: translation initiation factor IF-2 [Abditibacteriaceae bacterium]|jgi:translation initiation factor IF-2